MLHHRTSLQWVEHVMFPIYLTLECQWLAQFPSRATFRVGEMPVGVLALPQTNMFHGEYSLDIRLECNSRSQASIFVRSTGTRDAVD